MTDTASELRKCQAGWRVYAYYQRKKGEEECTFEFYMTHVRRDRASIYDAMPELTKPAEPACNKCGKPPMPGREMCKRCKLKIIARYA